jgi:hypothetical protein
MFNYNITLDRESKPKAQIIDRLFIFSVYEIFAKIKTAGTKSKGTKRCLQRRFAQWLNRFYIKRAT